MTKMAIRCLGNLSGIDQNILTLVFSHTTQTLVQSLESHPEDDEILQMGIEVIGNFAGLDDEDEDIADELGERSVYDAILSDGGVSGIIAAIEANESNSSLMLSAIEALTNIASDTSAAEEVAVLGCVEMVLQVMVSHDWDDGILHSSVELLAMLSISESGLAALKDCDGIQTVLNAMDGSDVNDNEFLLNGCRVLNSVAIDPDARHIIAENNGVKLLLGLMERCTAQLDVEEIEDDDENEELRFLQNATHVLTRLAVDDRLSAEVASFMHIILDMCRTLNEAQFLSTVFGLIGQVAFLKENIANIVQHRGIEVIMTAISEHVEEENLIVKAIKTLDNISTANEEYAELVANIGGKQIIEQVIETYEGNEMVRSAGQSALVSMNAMISLQTKIEMPEMPEELKPEVDPLEKYRTMLKSGSQITEYHRGATKSRHFFASNDWSSIVLRDPKLKPNTTKKGGQVIMPLRNVISVDAGKQGDNHKRLIGRKAKDECCLNLVGTNETISVEFQVPSDAKRWCEALTALHKTYKTNRKWLLPQYN